MKFNFRDFILFLKTIHIRIRLLKAGKSIFIDPSSQFGFPNKIILNDHVHISMGVKVTANSNQEPPIEVDSNSFIGEYSILSANRGSIKIGKNTFINSHCVLHGNGDILIGDYVALAPYCMISSVAHPFSSTDIPITEQPNKAAPIEIEDDVWLGAGAKVMQGFPYKKITIGKGTVISAGSIVTKSIPEYSIVTGNPAKIIASRKKT